MFVFHVIVKEGESTKQHDVVAAYPKSEETWLVFKDRFHREMARFAAETVLSSVRGEFRQT
jgi:hypothetical protein